MKLKAGVKKDGTLTALELTGLGEVGAYPSNASVGYQIGDLYKCPQCAHVKNSWRMSMPAAIGPCALRAIRKAIGRWNR